MKKKWKLKGQFCIFAKIQLAKKKLSFLFTHCSLPHCVSLTIFSYSFYFSLLFYLLLVMQFFNIAPFSVSLAGTSPLFSSYSLVEWPLLLFLHLFILFFLSHSCHQMTINNATHLPWLCFSQFLFSSALPFRSNSLNASTLFFFFLLSVSTTPKINERQAP